MMRQVGVLLLILLLSPIGVLGMTPTAPQPQLPGVYTALSRIPDENWQTIAFTDYTHLMQSLGETWPPEKQPNAVQQQAWNTAWQPLFMTLELPFSPYQMTHVVEARRDTDFMLWVEGTFNTLAVATALPEHGYERLSTFPIEAYAATPNSTWREIAPYIALPGQQMILVASSELQLQTMLQLYDGHTLPIVRKNSLLNFLSESTSHVSSSVLRFDQPSANCPAEDNQVAAHGLRYDATLGEWQYVLNIGYDHPILLADARYLTERLEFSTTRPSLYDGVVGQHTTITNQRLYESGTNNILQLTLRLRNEFEALPFDLATQPDLCQLFTAPNAAAVSMGMALMQDLGAARTDGTIRYGNVEQALYNAGLNTPVIRAAQILTPAQEAALNSTWRTDLAFEPNFEQWFGFSPEAIYQTIEMTFSIGDYERIVWGNFTVEEVEAALKANGYVAVEQYLGVRVFILRDVPESGGFLLDSLAKIVAVPQDGVMVIANTQVNLHLLMDVLTGAVRSTLPFARDLLLTTRALEDATNVIIHRSVNPVSGGLVCGLPAYRIEAFANVLRPDGWHFLYALGFFGTRQDGETLAANLAAVLENSDYPLQGPGSATIGELATVVDSRAIAENDGTVIVVEMRIEGSDQQASFFGQDFAQANLPPCALGDIAQ